jgi:HK97 family phage major capsid protein
LNAWDRRQAGTRPGARQHGPHTGTHHHSHPAYGTGADDDGEHSHAHDHDDDGSHDHDHQGVVFPAARRHARGGVRARPWMAAAPPEHPPVRTTHKHYHLHPDGHVTGLDADGGHSHMHSHGKKPDSSGPPAPDNDHDHQGDHTEGEWPPGEAPETAGRARQRGSGSMARRYVNPNHRAAALTEDWITVQAGAQYSIPDGQVTAADRRAFLRGQAEAAMRRLPVMCGPPGSARNALYDRRAPGAAQCGLQGSVGELVAALYQAAAGTGPGPVVNAMSERVPAEGGFLVAEDLRSDLMLIELEESVIRPRATVIPMREYREHVPVVEEGSDTSGSVLGGFQFEWTEEGSPIVSSVPGLGRVTLTAKKLAGYALAPNELMADAAKLDAFLRLAIPAGLAFAEDQALIAGSGSGQPLGILQAGCQVQVTRQTSDEVTVQDVYKMTTRMLPRSMASFIWLCSPDVLAQLLDISLNVSGASSGIVPPPLWLDFDDAEGCWTLLKRPLYSTEHVSALGTTGDLVAVDPRFVVIGDRQEMTIEVATGGEGFISDKSEIRIIARVDGRVWPASPVTPQNGSETVSPVVVLGPA